MTIKGWDIPFDLSKPLRAQSESQILKLECVRTRASKEAVARVGSVTGGPLASNVLHLNLILLLITLHYMINNLILFMITLNDTLNLLLQTSILFIQTSHTINIPLRVGFFSPIIVVVVAMVEEVVVLLAILVVVKQVWVD